MSLHDTFAEAYGRPPDGVWFAPGRVNLIGEHTDYNDGFVLPMALQQGVVARVARRDDSTLRVRSQQEDGEVSCDVESMRPGDVEGWGAYVAGVLWALREKGVDVAGLDVLVDGDVPSGAGLSSSAAIECAVATACRDLLGAELDDKELAGIARSAENDFVGAPTGFMDQLASMCCREGQALFLDCRSLDIEQVPFDPSGTRLSLLVIDSRAPHALVDSEYADRRAACERAARTLGVDALRDITVDELGAALARLDDDVVRRRVRHVVTEDARVLEVVRLLQDGGDPRSIGPLLTASHASMRDDFEITVPQVDLLVDVALNNGAHGARMTGGGFGGSVVALVEADGVDDVLAAVDQAFVSAGFDQPVGFVADPRDGARRLD